MKFFPKVVLIAGLGYLVDIYDLVIFGVVRMSSLKDLGYAGPDLFSKGLVLMNAQTSGLMLGGILWGVLADKFGRSRTLFASILIFSICTFTNAFVHSLAIYATLRFLTGVGLAGELGIGVTLVAESISKSARSYGSGLIFSVGMLGAGIASGISFFCGWRVAYAMGGVLGLLLIFFRSYISESSIFLHHAKSPLEKRNLKEIFQSRIFATKYICTILIGTAVQLVPGILIVFSPEIMASKHFDSPISVGSAILLNYLGVAFGSIFSAFVSEKWRSRKKAIFGFLLFTALMIAAFLLLPYHELKVFYTFCSLLGIGCGFWSVAILMCAEQFGTNVRGFVTTTISNFSRGGLLLITVLFGALSPMLGANHAALLLGLLFFLFAIVAVTFLQDTYGREMDYLE
jgi:MFS family permease